MTANPIVGVFLLITAVLYFLFTVPVLILTSRDINAMWILFGVLHECISLGLALDLSEHLLSLVVPPRRHPRGMLDPLALPRVAVLYVCRDDADPDACASLRSLRDVDIYILDDSVDHSSQEFLEGGGFTVVRRQGHAGFKAGNLNNWLREYGAAYDYFCILDADSIVHHAALWDMVAYAEHPANRDVAIVQSSISARPGNRFQRLQSLSAPLRNRVIRSLHDRIGWSLSHGHNNLHRTAAVQNTGGFGLESSCEDTLLSMTLIQHGWRIIQVATPTYEAEPPDVFAYRQRQCRWARQTVELAMYFRGSCGPMLALLLARHIFSYALPALCIVFLFAIALSPGVGFHDAVRVLVNYLRPQNVSMQVITTYVIWTSYLLLVGIRVVSLYRHHGRPVTVAASAVVGGALAAFCAFSVLGAMARSLLGARTDFVPTQARARGKPSLLSLLREMCGSWLAYFTAALLLLAKPGLLLFGLNGMWALTLLMAPLVLWFAHRDQERGGGRFGSG